MITSLGRRPRLSLALCAAWLMVDAGPAFAYLKLGVDVGGTTAPIRWSSLPVRYYVSDRGVDQVSPSDLQRAIVQAGTTWQAVASSAVACEFAGFTSTTPVEGDGMSTVGFVDRPSLDRVLATTTFTVDNTTGALVEADVVFNASFPWSVAASGESGRYDVESIALHEMGHMGGLGHSALGETERNADGTRRVLGSAAVMFPVAFAAGSVIGRVLEDDDIAGISDIYPDDGFVERTGSLSGRVTKNGAGLFGAHVVAFSPATGALVANFALNSQGQFSIVGLAPGPWLIRVEPLDDADVESFFAATSTVDLDFRVTFFDRLVPVPRGGDSGAVEIKVRTR